ncbi:MAG: competence/damage-inducible protein A [Bacteroidota bacterium]|nr:competence/damage-inducible protein A [Bacteroidota bacterium]
MKAEIITIGDELLIGQVVDTNSAWIANKLNLLGIDIYKIVSISDTKESIFKALEQVDKSTDLVIITGGLGPTNDDITKIALAEYFRVQLGMNNEVLEKIKAFVIKRNGDLNERNKQQALVPENCTVIQNTIGTAPGMWFEDNGKIIISMPGVPFEMKEMMNNHILEELKKRHKDFYILHKIILTQGLAESKLAEILEKWENNFPKELSVAYLPSPGIIKLRITGKGENRKYIEEQIDNKVNALKNIIPDYICGYDEDKLEENLGKLLKEKKATVSVAESCTGGNIGRLITTIPGCSDYFKGGIIAYSNEIKENILNVNRRNIEIYGAVSKQVVEEMSKGILELFNTDFSIATSGIAGPTGGSKEKPVGTTWIAVASKHRVITQKFVFGDQRDRNIQRASLTAINMLQKLIWRKKNDIF